MSETQTPRSGGAASRLLAPFLLMTGYAVLFTKLLLRRFESSAMGDPDVGIAAQMFHSTLVHGMPLFNTIEGQSHLGVHASPVYFVLVALYATSPSVETILFLQAVAVALVVWPAWLIARDFVGPSAAVAATCALLLYHPLHGVTYDQISELPFAVTPLTFALYFFLKRRWTPFWAFLLVTLTVKEEVGFVLMAWGLHCLLEAWLGARARRQSEKADRDEGSHERGEQRTAESAMLARQGVALLAVGAAAVYVALYVIIPHYRQGGYAFFSERYAQFGTRLTEVVINLVIHPDKTLGMMLRKQPVLYVLEMFLPFAFLPLRAPSLLIMTLPTFAINMLSSNSSMHHVGGRYTALIIPFMYGATVLAVARLTAARSARLDSAATEIATATPTAAETATATPTAAETVTTPARATADACADMRRKWMIGVATLAGACTLAFDTTPLRAGFRLPPITEHQAKVVQAVGMIPPGASVSTQAGPFQRLAVDRIEVYNGYHPGTDYILVDETSPWFVINTFWDRDLPRALANEPYREIWSDDGIRLFRRYPSREWTRYDRGK